MSAEAWDLLVRRLEAKAKAEPRGYRLRVAALAALGYLYIGGILLGVLGGAVAVVALAAQGNGLALKLLFPLGAFAWLVVRALPVKLDAPAGMELDPGDAPELHAEIERLRRETGAPRLHRVLVDGDINASVTQIPRFGPFGPSRNDLVLGLPLLQALSPSELQAVVAHELGHISARHGRFAARVYRLRERWLRLMTTLEHEGHWGVGLFRRFFRWYAPYFNAYSFVLVREHEYEADRAAGAAAGADHAAAALARVELAARYLAERYWADVYGRAAHEPRPTVRPFSALAVSLHAGPAADDLRRWAAHVEATVTDTTDTHPSFRDRVDALGVAPSDAIAAALRPPATTAAARYLGPTHDRLAAALDAQWQEDVSALWRAEYEDASGARRRFEELAGTAPTGGDLLEYAQLVERFDGVEAALPHYRAVLAEQPANPIAHYAVGSALLAAGDDAGLDHIEEAIDADVDALLPGCRLAASYLEERGRHHEAAGYRLRASDREERLRRAYAERQTLDLDGEVRDHDLPEAVVDDVRRRLSRYPAVKGAYLVRRTHTELDDEFPSYVIAVDLRVSRLRPHLRDPRPKLVAELAAGLETPFPFFVVDLGNAGPLKKKIRRLHDSRI